MSEKYFELNNLSVGYNRKALIKDICIDINKGEIVTLIGPNGAGKSTILKSITKQLQLINGNVRIAGSSIDELSYKDMAKRVSVVLTDRIKTELMTCYDIVATGRYPYTGNLGVLSEKDELKVSEALKMVNAEELGGRDFTRISDGQKQRILLARAICQEPELMVLDEPTSFLDIRYKLELLMILRNLARKNNITVVMSLHEIDLAQKISDKIVCVKGDHIYKYGRLEDIFDEELISNLYSLDNGHYDARFGSVELAGATGQPRVMVISNAGNGIPVYRRLARDGVPFVTAVTYTNDLDYEVARMLASKVITEEPFERISEDTMNEVFSNIDSVEKVILAETMIGSCNEGISEIIDYARKQGKLVLDKSLDTEGN